jgi:hypothetical protein
LFPETGNIVSLLDCSCLIAGVAAVTYMQRGAKAKATMRQGEAAGEVKDGVEQQ